MVKFSYIAKRNGKRYTGEAEARDRFELYRHVRKEGGEIISLTNTATKRYSFAYWNARLSTVQEHDKIVFATNLAAMMRAGLSITRALSVAEKQARNPKLKLVITRMKASIRSGNTFHESLAKFPSVFSSIFVAMVRAGEASGGLSDALNTIAGQLNRAYLLKKKIKGAMLYPSIIIVAIVGIGILMMVKVVPQLAGTFNELGADLPASTQAIISLSDAITNNIILTIIAFFLFATSFFTVPRTKIGSSSLDWLILHIPTLGDLSREINSARMARTLSSLLSSGVDISSALSISSEVIGNHYHKEVLKEAQKDVQEGKKLSDTFAKNEHLFPPLVGEMIAVGEETGELASLLLEVANFYETEVEQKTKDMSTIIEPFLMLIIGAAVGFFAVAMIAPIYGLSEAI